MGAPESQVLSILGVFLRHSCPLSVLSNPWWSEVVQWMKLKPPHGSAAALILLAMFFALGAPRV